MTRENLALDLGRKAFNEAMEIINGESPDMGIALAACAYMGHWLQAEIEANKLLNVRALANMPNPKES